jgi:hypothetical protein
MGPDFVDLDRDHILEFRTYDMSWRVFGAASHVPIVILKYHRQTGRYQLAGDLMRQPLPSDAALLNQAENIAMRMRALYPEGVRPGFFDDSIAVELWGKMIDLIYSGYGQRAWQFFDLAWPDQIPGKAENIAEFREVLEHSEYWQQLAAFSGLD